jgi:hypothetical protein
VSVQTLAFVARRLLAERVGLVFALRESGDDHELEGLPEIVIEGLAAADARRLLDTTIPGSLDARVRDWIPGEAGAGIWHPRLRAQGSPADPAHRRGAAGSCGVAEFRPRCGPPSPMVRGWLAAYRRLRDLSGKSLEPTAQWSIIPA